MIGGSAAHKRSVLPPRRVELSRWRAWAQANLLPSDAVVLEATTRAWAISALLITLVGPAVVAHPAKLKLIAEARVKTDTIDVLTLAHLLRAAMLPEVWVPPPHVRDLRALLSHRRRHVALQTSAKNRLQRVLHRLKLRPPHGDLFAQKQRAWWTDLDLSLTERLRLDQDVATLDHIGPQIAAVDAELRRLSTRERWAEQVPYLVHLPGIALLRAMTILGAVGAITRFPSAKQLVGDAGLGAGVHDRGKTHRDKGITKQGRRELRSVLIEAARAASQSHPYWKRTFAQREKRIGEPKALVAMARKRLIVVWHVLMAARRTTAGGCRAGGVQADGVGLSADGRAAWRLELWAVHPRTPDPARARRRLDAYHTWRHTPPAGDDRGGAGAATGVAQPAKPSLSGNRAKVSRPGSG